MADSPLLDWSRRLAAIAQSGLAFDPGVYDRQRYEELVALAAEMATWPDGDMASVAAAFTRDLGYATPKLVCRGAVFDRERILMVRETIDGLWTIPGGWIDVGEGPTAAVEREVWEETGYQVTADKLAMVADKRRYPHPPVPHHSYILFFLCTLRGGSPRPSVETSEVGWFAEDDLPSLSTNRVVTTQVHRMFRHHRDPGRPTDVD